MIAQNTDGVATAVNRVIKQRAEGLVLSLVDSDLAELQSVL